MQYATNVIEKILALYPKDEFCDMVINNWNQPKCHGILKIQNI